jgi:hypothetical protein
VFSGRLASNPDTASISSIGLNGLTMYRSAPASMPAATSLCWPQADSSTILTPALAGSCRPGESGLDVGPLGGKQGKRLFGVGCFDDAAQCLQAQRDQQAQFVLVIDDKNGVSGHRRAPAVDGG